MKLLLIIVLGLAAQFAQAADSIGRIFFTPEQRTQLDTLRTQKAVASRVREEPVPEIVTYSGIVRRSDGKATVWINDEALSEADLRNKASIAGRISRDGRVSLQAPQSAVELKVGQSATLFSGKVEEAFTQRPAPVPQPKPNAKPQPTGTGAAAPALPQTDQISIEEAAKIAPVDAATAARLKAQAEALR